MGIFKISIVSILIFFAVPAIAQTNTQVVCLNNVKVTLDTSWVKIASPNTAYTRYEDDDFEEYETIHYFKGKIDITIYEKDRAFWPGAITITSPKDTLVIDNIVLPIVGQSISTWPDKLSSLFSQSYNKNYATTEGKIDFLKIPDISSEITYILSKDITLHVSIVCALEKGIVQRVSMLFTK